MSLNVFTNGSTTGNTLITSEGNTQISLMAMNLTSSSKDIEILFYDFSKDINYTIFKKTLIANSNFKIDFPILLENEDKIIIKSSENDVVGVFGSAITYNDINSLQIKASCEIITDSFNNIFTSPLNKNSITRLFLCNTDISSDVNVTLEVYDSIEEVYKPILSPSTLVASNSYIKVDLPISLKSEDFIRAKLDSGQTEIVNILVSSMVYG